MSSEPRRDDGPSRRRRPTGNFADGLRSMRGLPRVVWVLGLASLLNDVSSEAIFPLLPLFLTSLGAPMRFLGLIEGSADALASILKVVAGRLSDRGPRRLFVAGGYAIPRSPARASPRRCAPWHVLAARLFDRTGKGIRSGPRDAMIADSVSALAARARLRPQPVDGSLRRGARAAARERAAAGPASACARCS